MEVYSNSNQVSEGCLRLVAIDQLGELSGLAVVPAFIRPEHGQIRGVSVEARHEDTSLALILPLLEPRQSVFIIFPCSPKVGLGSQVAVRKLPQATLTGSSPAKLHI